MRRFAGMLAVAPPTLEIDAAETAVAVASATAKAAAIGQRRKRSAADLAHRSLWSDERHLIDLMSRPLGANGALDLCRQRLVVCSVAHQLAQIEFGRGEQACPELAVRGDAHAVAVAAERLRHGWDHADGAAAVEVAPSVGRGRAPRLHLLERKHVVDPGDDLVLSDDLLVDPVTAGVERHVLDVPHLHVAFATEPGKVDDL